MPKNTFKEEILETTTFSFKDDTHGHGEEQSKLSASAIENPRNIRLSK